MSNLIRFFLPHIIKLAFIYYALLAGALIGLKILGLDIYTFETFVTLIIWFFIPLVYYNNAKTYLPKNLNWILLAPIKKTDIWVAHIILGILKITICLFFSFSLWFMFFVDGTIKQSFNSFLTLIYSIFSEPYTSFEFFYLLIWILISFMSVVATIFPDIHQINKGERKSSNFVQLIRMKKNITYILLAMAFAFLLLDMKSDIPEFILLSLLPSIGILIPIFATSYSLKLYYNWKILACLTFGTFFFLCGLFIMVLHINFRHNKGDIDVKLSNYASSGFIATRYKKEMYETLSDDSINLKALREYDLRIFFEASNTKDLFLPIFNHWSKACINGDAISCRLQAYLLTIKNKKIPMDLYLKACPKDLQSCFIISSLKQTPDNEKEIARKHVENACADSTLAKEICCNCKDSRSTSR